MPAYDAAATSINKPLVTAGRPVTVWDAEDVNTGDKSRQVCFHRDPNFPNVFSVEIEFSGDPGAFQIDVETADEDADKYYVSKGSLTSGLNGSFVGRIEVVSSVAKFARLNAVLITNNVNVTAKFF